MESTYPPVVSVILPVYNRPSVVDTIKSILNQTFSDFELIVIDNASTDNTCQVINSISDNRIRLLINEQNMGQTYSLNRGLEVARGKYIARIDSDDIALPDRLMKQVHFLENNKDYVLCGSWVRFISDSNELGRVVKTCTTSQGLRFMQTVACGMYHPSAMYRSEIISKYNIRYDYKIRMAEDYDLWAKLLSHGNGLNLGEVLIYYRRGSNNDSRIHSAVMGKESSLIREEICKRLEIDQNEKRRILREINLEKKENKTIFETIRIAIMLYQYLKKNIKRSSVDYKILRTHIALKIYSSCIAKNNRMYARLLARVYKKMRDG